TKTGASALVVCLNIDIDPPDVQKIPPYSKVEAWFDPTDANSLRALEVIGRNLQAQYERWQPRARFKQCLDPTLEDVKNLTISLRRNVKGDRILFHYNGHGVPRPTENGEIWVFNTKFTKYIPLSLYDLQRWLGAPSVYVFDCQNAGRVIRMYEIFCRRRMAEVGLLLAVCYKADGAPIRKSSSDYHNRSPPGSTTPAPNNPHLVTNPPVTMENTIMLAACREDEDLPQNPELPADLFTACLTTPIRMALRWHWLRHQESFPGYLDEALLDRIPGAHSNRMSLLGEINWIFTAVTDTIAWCSFPIDLFQKLFRQDLLVAGLFRNFLLAERIMKTYGCTPVSAPALPTTFRHSMWTAWDHTLDRLVHYLPRILKVLEGNPTTELKLPIILPSSPGNSHQQHHQQIPSGVAQLSQIGMVTTPMPPTMAGAAEQNLVEVSVSHRLNQRGAHVTSSGGLPALAHGKRTAEALQLDDTTAKQNFYGQAAPTNRVICDLDRKQSGKFERPIARVVYNCSVGYTYEILISSLDWRFRPLPRHPAADGFNQQLASEPDAKQRPSQEGRVRHPTRDPSLVDTQTERLATQKDLTTHLEEAEKPTEEKQADGTRSKAEADSQQPEMNSHTTGTAANDEDDSDVDVDEDELDDEDEVDDSDDESDESYEVNEEDSMKGVARSCWTAEDKPLPITKVTESAPPKLGKDQIHTTPDVPPPDKMSKQNAPDPISKPPLTKEATQVEQPQPVKLDAEQLKQLVNYSNAQIDGRLPNQNTAQGQPVYQTQKKTSTGAMQKTASTGLPPAQITDARPPECTLTALRRQQHVLQGLYTLQTPNGNNQTTAQTANNPAVPQVVCPPNPTTMPANFVACATPTPAGHTPNHSVQPQSQQLPGAPASNPPVYAGSVIGGSGPASFFTSQMTAFKVWLQTADEKQPPAMQLPILLQILLSQSHRTRAMQLLSEFLDLGPWAVTHCLMVGILPYIARLFSSSLSEVKPHLVFIWGKIIASAQTEFSRSDSVRDGGFKYFMNCLNDTENLSPLTRTITAFALTKMLEKEPFGEPDAYFQDASLKQNFLPMVLSQLSENPPSLERELPIRMRLWLIFGLSKLWRKHDDARWFGIRYNVTEVLFNYLDDVSPEVRAATTYALGTLVDNQTTDSSKKDHADQISQQVITRLIKLATLEASPLVRCELVAALCPLVRQFETQLCAMAHHYLQELQQLSSTAAASTGTALSRPIGRLSRHSVSGFAPSSHFTGRPDDVGTPPRPSAIKDDGPVKARRTEPLALPTFFAGTTNVYAQFWLALVQLSNDPYPKVAQMTRQIMNYLLTRKNFQDLRYGDSLDVVDNHVSPFSPTLTGLGFRIYSKFGVPLAANSPPCASVTTGDHPERTVPSSTPESGTTSPLTTSSMRPVSNPSNQRNSFSNESSPPNTVERASGPASTIKNNSPNTQPHMSHSMCSSPNNVPVNYPLTVVYLRTSLSAPASNVQPPTSPPQIIGERNCGSYNHYNNDFHFASVIVRRRVALNSYMSRRLNGCAASRLQNKRRHSLIFQDVNQSVMSICSQAVLIPSSCGNSRDRPIDTMLPRGRSQRILEEYFDGSRIVELVLNSTIGTSYFSRIARLMARDLGCDHPQGEGDFVTHGETCCTSATKIPKDWRVFACVQDVSQHVIGCAVVQELTATLIESRAYKLRVLPGGISDLLTWTVQAKDVHGNLVPKINENIAPPASDNPTSLGPVLCGVRRLWVTYIFVDITVLNKTDEHTRPTWGYGSSTTPGLQTSSNVFTAFDIKLAGRVLIAKYVHIRDQVDVSSETERKKVHNDSVSPEYFGILNIVPHGKPAGIRNGFADQQLLLYCDYVYTSYDPAFQESLKTATSDAQDKQAEQTSSGKLGQTCFNCA
ncbi:regulatory associated protein of mTOR, partial [Clonorchis sinensis]